MFKKKKDKIEDELQQFKFTFIGREIPYFRVEGLDEYKYQLAKEVKDCLKDVADGREKLIFKVNLDIDKVEKEFDKHKTSYIPALSLIIGAVFSLIITSFYDGLNKGGIVWWKTLLIILLLIIVSFVGIYKIIDKFVAETSWKVDVFHEKLRFLRLIKEIAENKGDIAEQGNVTKVKTGE